MLRVVKTVETESRMVVAAAEGREDGELVSNGDRVLVCEDDKVLEMDGCDGYKTT